MRSMPWCKLWNESRTDKKLSHLTLAERGVWSNLLTYANEQEERGTFDASDRFSLALECAEGEEDTLNSALDKLVKVHHLEAVVDHPGWLTFRTWNMRQSRKPSDDPERAAERQRRARAARRDEDESRNVTRDRGVTDSKKRHVTRESRKKANVTRLEERDIRDKRKENISYGEDSISSYADASESGEPLTRTRTVKQANPHWDALVSIFGYEPRTSSERSKWGKAVKEFKDAKATADDMLAAKATYDREYAAGLITWKLSPLALAAHLGELLQGPRPMPHTSQNGHARTAANSGPTYTKSYEDALPKE